jgi:hypothetical protein
MVKPKYMPIAELSTEEQSDLFPDIQEDTQKANRATQRRLTFDLPVDHWDHFFRESRNNRMSMRRYFYVIWDKYTGGNRLLNAFPPTEKSREPSATTAMNRDERGDKQRLTIVMPHDDWNDIAAEARRKGYTAISYFYLMWDYCTKKQRLKEFTER